MECTKCKSIYDDTFFYCPHCGKASRTKPHGAKYRGNGQGTVYKLPNGKWRAEVTLVYNNIENGQYKKRVPKTKSDFKTKKEALAYLPLLKDPNYNKLKDMQTIKELYDEWNEEHCSKLSPDKQSHLKTAWERCKPLYYKNIATVTTQDIEDTMHIGNLGYYPQKDIKTIMMGVFKKAIKKNYVNVDYAKLADLPKYTRPQKEIFPPEEIEKMWKLWNEGHKELAMVMLMIYCGLRPKEAREIKLSNVFIDKQYFIAGIKTDAGINREIPIANFLIPIVEHLKVEAETNNKTKLIYYSEEMFRKLYKQSLDDNGIMFLYPKFCRKTCASALTVSGVPIGVIVSILGHEDYETTIKDYTTISIADKISAVNSLRK